NAGSGVLFALFPCVCRRWAVDRIRHVKYPYSIPRPVRRFTGMSISKVNPSTLIGALAGVLMLAIVLAVSASDRGMYVNLPGLAIVLGGTLAAAFISYPLREVRRVFALLRTIFKSEQNYIDRDIDELVQISQLWMKNDVRKVEEALGKVSNPFLRTGVQLVIDHTPEDQIIELMQWRIARLRAREQAEAQMFRVMAGF